MIGKCPNRNIQEAEPVYRFKPVLFCKLHGKRRQPELYRGEGKRGKDCKSQPVDGRMAEASGEVEVKREELKKVRIGTERKFFRRVERQNGVASLKLNNQYISGTEPWCTEAGG